MKRDTDVVMGKSGFLQLRGERKLERAKPRRQGAVKVFTYNGLVEGVKIGKKNVNFTQKELG
jgi:hypothetical protein